MTKTFTISDEYITLGQLLKAANIISSGAEVKAYLASEYVEVNGEPENRRGKKLRHDDVILLPGDVKIKIEAPAQFRP
jgi:ribosome-associated protein